MNLDEPSSPLLEVQHLSYYVQKTAILTDIALTVQPRQITAIVGADGAGKTTLLKILSGLIRDISGKIWFAGEEIGALPAWEVVKRGLVYVPEGMRVFPQMSVLENLEVGAYCHREGMAERLARVLQIFPELQDHLSQPAGLLSGGQQRMVTLGRGLMPGPRLLLLDEPFMGLSPKLITRFCNSFRDLAQDGVTLLISGQHIRRVLKIAERAYILEEGRITRAGVGVDLLQDSHLQEILFIS
uniref:ABC transporter ATP-binding protein n=1 Tax=Desulfobacca acetoxidans TaxID=60893 RepID=A0A7C3V3K7_9BACT